MQRICQYPGCTADLTGKHGNAKYCTIHAKAGYRQRQREYMKEYKQRPEVKQRQRKYNQRPEVKQRQRKYNQRPEVKQRQREQKREYYQRPEVKQRHREYMREYNQRPEVKQRNKVVKVGNTENIKQICKDHDISEDIATAIALDGEVLDQKMRERGMLK